MSFDALVFIGRFQPFHKGHQFVVEQAFAHTNHLILLIGSSNRPSSFKNPFDFDERKQMIEQSVSLTDGQQLTILPLPDAIYNEQLWLQSAQRAVFSVTKPDDKIGLIGHTKDDSSYYLRLFPTWGYCEVENFANLSATPIRQAFFEQEFGVFLAWHQDNLPKSVQMFLDKFRQSKHYNAIVQEQAYLKNYQAQFAHLPYPPIFQTVDAVVVQAGHMIERGGDYGKGLLALAGGFVDVSESLQTAVVRELQEETGLDLSAHIAKAQRVFDTPNRSMRGRTISTVFLYELTGDKLPALKAGDDASQAIWLPLGLLDGKVLFEDHYGIICAMLGIS